MDVLVSLLQPLFATYTVAGVPLLALTVGLVEWLKSAKFNGKSISGDITRIVSLVVGLALGLGYRFSVVGLPVDFVGWFTDVVLGLSFGLLASKLYDAAGNATTNTNP